MNQLILTGKKNYVTKSELTEPNKGRIIVYYRYKWQTALIKEWITQYGPQD